MLLAERREAEGLSWLERSCGGWPKIPECAYYEATYRAERGDAVGAREAALEALRRDPAFVPARELLGRLGP